MPAPYSKEFREDVVRVAWSREDGVTLAQITKDFGVHEMSLHKWVRQADIDDGIGSMGQVGAVGDNAAMESCFTLLRKNVLYRKRWRTRDKLRIAIITWIERTYHRRR